MILGLGLAFIVLNWLFLTGDLVNLSTSLLIASVFIGIGGLVTILSDNIASLIHRYQYIFDMSGAGILITDRETQGRVRMHVRKHLEERDTPPGAFY